MQAPLPSILSDLSNVERSPVRIFEDKEFEDVGATMVPTGSWPDAPQDHIIIGLKELPEEECTPPQFMFFRILD